MNKRERILNRVTLSLENDDTMTEAPAELSPMETTNNELTAAVEIARAEADSSAADVAINTIYDDMDEDAAGESTVQQLYGIADGLSNIRNNIANTLPEGGLTNGEAIAYHTAVDATLQPMGIKAEAVLPSVESFGGELTRTEATELSMESIGKTIKNVGKRIWIAIQRAWKWIKERYTGMKAKLQKVVDNISSTVALAKKYPDAKWEATVDGRVLGWVSTDGKSFDMNMTTKFLTDVAFPKAKEMLQMTRSGSPLLGKIRKGIGDEKVGKETEAIVIPFALNGTVPYSLEVSGKEISADVAPIQTRAGEAPETKVTVDGRQVVAASTRVDKIVGQLVALEWTMMVHASDEMITLVNTAEGGNPGNASKVAYNLGLTISVLTSAISGVVTGYSTVLTKMRENVIKEKHGAGEAKKADNGDGQPEAAHA